MPETPAPRFRALYAGDDPRLGHVLRTVLSESQYQVITCGDPESVLRFLESDIPYDLLIIDLEWRGKAGFKLARRLKSLEHRKNLQPVLIAPEELSTQLERLGRGTGIENCLIKTPNMKQLIAAIKAVNRQP